MSPAAGIQSSAPAKVDASLAHVKGHDYYTDTFVPPSEEVTEIDPRDKVSADSAQSSHFQLSLRPPHAERLVSASSRTAKASRTPRVHGISLLSSDKHEDSRTHHLTSAVFCLEAAMQNTYSCQQARPRNEDHVTCPNATCILTPPSVLLGCLVTIHSGNAGRLGAAPPRVGAPHRAPPLQRRAAGVAD